MNTIGDLVEAIRGGKRPVVTFCAGIGDKESYAEEGMRARIVGLPVSQDSEVVKLSFDFEEFAAHNTPLESANYYDNSKGGGGRACLTARQAGFYKPQDDIYFDLEEKLATHMKIEEAEAIALFEAYKAEGASCSYVSWLEKKVLRAGL